MTRTKKQSAQGDQSDGLPFEIKAGNLRRWIGETIRNEMYHRQGVTKTLSLQLALRMLKPNLQRPVFLIGAPRSGTTFLGECLLEFPELSYHFEPVITKAAVRYVNNGQWSDMKARFLYRSTYAWLMRISYAADRRFCEKTPGNCFILPFLERSFSGAKFIHIVRDGRDASLSLSKKPWYANDSRSSGRRDPDGYPYGPWRRFWVEESRVSEFENTDDWHRCIWLWRRYVESALEGAKSISSEHFYQLRYEDLLAEPASYADRISEFLGIQDPLSRKSFREKMAASAHADSIGRWRVEITDQKHNQLLNEAGTLLRQLGYEC